MKTLLLFISILLLFKNIVNGSDEEERLMLDLFRSYNPLIRPVKNVSDIIQIRIAIQLVLLINILEKEQTMMSNIWITLKWADSSLKWNPVNYGDIKEIRVDPIKLWNPDIVLFNNGDGNFEASYMCNCVVNFKGEVLFVPPAIFKSSCMIDVEFFPFDEQLCTLLFGSWTYSDKEITLDFDQAPSIDLQEYSPSSIWDVVDAYGAQLNKRSRIEFQLKVRRKYLFYVVVLLIPTILMAFLSLSVFFLPTESTEKITLTISVLLSIVLFLLVVSKILPPSSTIPLIAKYLLLTFVLNVITILTTVIIINVYFRGPTQVMPVWVRILFLKYIPILLCMKRPRQVVLRKNKTRNSKLRGVGEFNVPRSGHHPMCPIIVNKDNVNTKEDWTVPTIQIYNSNSVFCGKDKLTAEFYPLTREVSNAIDAIEYITDHIRKDEEYKMYRDDWKYVGMLIDRLMLYIFFGITLGGSVGILFSAPTVFENVNQKTELQKLINKYIQSTGTA